MYILSQINNIPYYYKILFIVLMTSLLHYLFGWLFPLVFNLLFVGFLLNEFIMLTVTITGTLVNAIPTLYYFIKYNDAAVKITADLSKALGNVDDVMVLLVSVLIPLIMYTIAGLFAWQLAEIRIKLTS